MNLMFCIILLGFISNNIATDYFCKTTFGNSTGTLYSLVTILKLLIFLRYTLTLKIKLAFLVVEKFIFMIT